VRFNHADCNVSEYTLNLVVKYKNNQINSIHDQI